MEKTPSYNPDEIPEMQKQRILSDAEAVTGGAGVSPEGQIAFTPEQKEAVYREMELDKAKDAEDRRVLTEQIHTKETEVAEVRTNIEKARQMIEDVRKEMEPVQKEIAHLAEGMEWYETQRQLEECSTWLTAKDGEFDRMASEAKRNIELLDRDLKNAPRKSFGRRDKELEAQIASRLERVGNQTPEIQNLKETLARSRGMVDAETAQRLGVLAETYPQSFTLYRHFRGLRDKIDDLGKKLTGAKGQDWQNRGAGDYRRTDYTPDRIEKKKQELEKELGPKELHFKELQGYLTHQERRLNQLGEEVGEARGRLARIERGK